MTNQKWYNKASVQVAIVSGIPVICTAVIAIFTLVITCNNSNRQISLFEKQYFSDSVNSALQLQLVNKQIEIVYKNYLNDSLIGIQQLQIAKTQLNQLITQVNTQSNIDKIKLGTAIINITRLMPGGIEEINKLTINERLGLVDTIIFFLNRERYNPVLVKNKKCLNTWNGVIFNFEILKKNTQIISEDFLPAMIISYWQSIMTVYEDLIIRSK